MSASTLVFAGPGRLARVSVTTAGAADALDDSATVGGIGTANQIGVVPAVVGVYFFDWPCLNGLVYAPDTGQIASVSFT